MRKKQNHTKAHVWFDGKKERLHSPSRSQPQDMLSNHNGFFGRSSTACLALEEAFRPLRVGATSLLVEHRYELCDRRGLTRCPEVQHHLFFLEHGGLCSDVLLLQASLLLIRSNLGRKNTSHRNMAVLRGDPERRKTCWPLTIGWSGVITRI